MALGGLLGSVGLQELQREHNPVFIGEVAVEMDPTADGDVFTVTDLEDSKYHNVAELASVLVVNSSDAALLLRALGNPNGTLIPPNQIRQHEFPRGVTVFDLTAEGAAVADNEVSLTLKLRTAKI